MGTGEHVAEVFVLLAVGTLLDMIGVIVVVFDKLSSLVGGAEIEPIVDELRLIDSLFRLGTSCYLSNESQATMWHHCWSLQLYLA